jgi:hypothetical protein
VRWILDDGPFDTLAAHVEPSDPIGYPPGKLIAVPTTELEARQSSPRARFLEAASPEGGQVVEVFDPLVGGDDPAGEIFLELHGEEGTATNRAEREAIAWALAHGTDAVLVLEDKRAALTALAELGRARVAHSFDLWIDLLDVGAVTPGEFQRLCKKTRGRDGGLNRMPSRVERRFP